jgi:hypothetical protein
MKESRGSLNLNLKLSLMGRGECATSSRGKGGLLEGLLGFPSPLKLAK